MQQNSATSLLYYNGVAISFL